MRVEILKSKRDNSVYVQLPECVGFFNANVAEDLIVGNTYDVMIVGFSKKLNQRTKFPATVFFDVIGERDKFINAPILQCSGTMCSTSTWTMEHGPIYPGYNTPVPEVGNVNNNFDEMPNYPTPNIDMWIRETNRGYRAVGVDKYSDIAPVFFAQHEGIQRVSRAYAERHAIWNSFLGAPKDEKGEVWVNGFRMWEAYDDLRTRLGIVRKHGSWQFETENTPC